MAKENKGQLCECGKVHDIENDRLKNLMAEVEDIFTQVNGGVLEAVKHGAVFTLEEAIRMGVTAGVSAMNLKIPMLLDKVGEKKLRESGDKVGLEFNEYLNYQINKAIHRSTAARKVSTAQAH